MREHGPDTHGRKAEHGDLAEGVEATEVDEDDVDDVRAAAAAFTDVVTHGGLKNRQFVLTSFQAVAVLGEGVTQGFGIGIGRLDNHGAIVGEDAVAPVV